MQSLSVSDTSTATKSRVTKKVSPFREDELIRSDYIGGRKKRHEESMSPIRPTSVTNTISNKKPC